MRLRYSWLLLSWVAIPVHGQPVEATPPPIAAAHTASSSTPAAQGTQAHQAEELVQRAAAVEENPDWAVTLERIASSVVAIDVDSTRAFDTEWNSTAQATGFVVDAE